MAFNVSADLSIDVSHIWQFEQAQYQKGKISLAVYQALRASLSYYYLLKQRSPFISKEKVAEDPSLAAYYQRYLAGYDRQTAFYTDHFLYEGGFYDLNAPCVISRKDVSPSQFATLFALTLHQFEEAHNTLQQFLTYHFYTSFEGDVTAYSDFIAGLCEEVDLLSEGLRLDLDSYRQRLCDLPEEGLTPLKIEHTAQPPLDWLLSLDVGSGMQPPALDSWHEGADKNEIPTDYSTTSQIKVTVWRKRKAHLQVGAIANPKRWTGAELQRFFSFLSLHRGEGEGSYLSREQVSVLLRDGLTVPEQPLPQRFALNRTTRYSAKIVHFFVYRFIEHFNPPAKKAVLQFLGSYIEDYAPALDEARYASFASNITGERGRMREPFAVEQFLPERLLLRPAVSLRR